MTCKLSLASWLAADAGIPAEVQDMFDLSEFEDQAKAIEEGEQSC